MKDALPLTCASLPPSLPPAPSLSPSLALQVVAPRGSDLHLSFTPDSKAGAHLLFLEMAQKPSPSAYDD